MIMNLSITEKIKLILIKRKMSSTALAMAIGNTRQNLANKFKRDNFSIDDLKKIAIALNCTIDTTFILNDTGETI